MHSLPLWLIARLRALLSEEDFTTTLAGFSQKRLNSLRVNTLKSTPEEIIETCVTLGVHLTPTSINGAYTFDGAHIHENGKTSEYILKGSSLFREGKIYLQSLSSQLPVHILDPQEWEKILDVCAAPGGKTTQIAALTKNNAQIVACEKNVIRKDKLAHNILLQWVTSVEIIKKDAITTMKSLEKESFDRILIDAPCSAEGRICIEDERTFGFWKRSIIASNAELQSQLISEAIPLLKTGGTLVYSTCTLSPEENEGIVTSILNSHPDLALIPIAKNESHFRDGIPEFHDTIFHRDIRHCLRILPTSEWEGFFIAQMKRVEMP